MVPANSIDKPSNQLKKHWFYMGVFYASQGLGPYGCYFCKEKVFAAWTTENLGSKRARRITIHHVDGNHDNNSPSNLVASHSVCHGRNHGGWGWLSGRPLSLTPKRTAAKKRRAMLRKWKDPVYRALVSRRVSEEQTKRWAKIPLNERRKITKKSGYSHGRKCQEGCFCGRHKMRKRPLGKAI